MKPQVTSGTTRRNGNSREQILAAAAHVLSRKGYSHTRLSDIAEIVGVRQTAVYHYFASREELVAEVMAVGQQRLREHVEAALEALGADASPMERIITAIEAHLRVALELSDFATAVTRNRGQLPEDARGLLRAEGTEYLALWRELLQQAQAAGDIPPFVDLRSARMLLMGALNWTPEWFNPASGSLESVVATAQYMLCGGLTAPAHPRMPLPHDQE